MKRQPKQVQNHLMTFSIIVHTTPQKVNQSQKLQKLPSQNSRNTHRRLQRSQRRLQIFKKQIQLEEAQAFDTVSEAKEKVRIAEMLQNLRNTPPIHTSIKKPSNILPTYERRLKQATQPSSSHPNSVHLTKNFTERDN